MPQMAPLPWVMIFFLTIFILLWMSSIIYFNYNFMINNKNKFNKQIFKIKW